MSLIRISIALFTRLWDRLTYRPWTNEQLAERVAKSVANTSYACNWGRPVEGEPVVGKPVWVGGYWTDEEIPAQEKIDYEFRATPTSTGD